MALVAVATDQSEHYLPPLSVWDLYMRILLAVEGDEERNVWVDVISPVEVLTENAPPHRVAIRVQSEATSPGERDATVWFRIDRIQAYRLVELLGERLGAGTAKGAEGITQNT